MEQLILTFSLGYYGYNFIHGNDVIETPLEILPSQNGHGDRHEEMENHYRGHGHLLEDDLIPNPVKNKTQAFLDTNKKAAQEGKIVLAK